MTTSIAQSPISISDTEARDFCKYIDLQARKAWYRQWHAPYHSIDDLTDAGYTGFVQALERSTIHDRFCSFVKMRIWGSVRSLRVAKAAERRRDVLFVRDLADSRESSAVDTDARLSWLDAQVEAHIACISPGHLTLYDAIRQGMSYGDYADSLGIPRSVMKKRYTRLVCLLREHLVEGTRTCADQAHRHRTKATRAYERTRNAALAGAVLGLRARGLSQNAICKQLKVSSGVVRSIMRTVPRGAGLSEKGA